MGTKDFIASDSFDFTAARTFRLGQSWGAASFAAPGFFTYHSMIAEQFIWAWLRSEVLNPRELRFESSTLYYHILKSSMEKREKEEHKRHD